MKLLFSLVIGCLLLTMTASATFITCTVPQDVAVFTGGSGSATAMCPALGPLAPNMVLDSIDIQYQVDYQFGSQNAGNDLRVVFSPITGLVPGPTTVDNIGGKSSGSIALITVSSASGLNLTTFPGFLISETATVVAGGAATSSAFVQVQYNTAMSDVPEPGTFAILGGSLLFLGILGRRRK